MQAIQKYLVLISFSRAKQYRLSIFCQVGIWLPTQSYVIWNGFLTPQDIYSSVTRGLLATDYLILNHGQVTWTTPELAPPLLATTPHQRQDVSALDRFNVQRCPTRRVFSGTGLDLVTSQTLNSDIYCQQLNPLKLAIDQKRPELANRRGVEFHEDNARTHTSVVTCQKLWELGWEVLMHPPYSPELAPSDYHLFPTLKNFLSDKKLVSREDCENRLLEFFANKDQNFYERSIMKLPLKWHNELYTTRRFIFDPNRTIRNMLNKVLNFR
ncbi:mariner Mos1 transposase [Trichonephila clavipes]|nr:mariner Mos1 transposase [Trichonephila clavipes]